ncbi:MAG: hypothetical protein WAX89_05690 [Alphaproteobacteria bacterium]
MTQTVKVSLPKGIELTQLTPELAAEWLQKYCLPDALHPVAPRNIRELARAMSEGRWLVNGDTIDFNPQGKIVGGKQRIKAVIQSGVTIPVILRRNVDDDAYADTDDTFNRNAAHILAAEGVKNSAQVAATIRALINYRSHVATGQNDLATVDRVRNFWQETPAIVEHVGACVSFYRKAELFFPGSGLAALYHWAKENGHAAAAIDYFFDKLCHGDELPKRNPIYQVREHAAMVKARGRSPSTLLRMVWLVRAFNAHAEDRPLRNIFGPGKGKTKDGVETLTYPDLVKA